jgi:peptidoglycan/xylan/chitin deacetylase (PgdA/CDA1 family)
VVTAGFPLGNHTYSHATLTHHDLAWIVADLKHQKRIVKDVLHTTLLPLLRPPGGAWNTVTRQAAKADGDKYLVLWDIDTRDWAGPSAALETKRALAGTNGSIILMHASLDNTPAALPGIIAGYRKRGFTFVTLGQMFGLPGPVPDFTP